jgi:hypothetical protein
MHFRRLNVGFKLRSLNPGLLGILLLLLVSTPFAYATSASLIGASNQSSAATPCIQQIDSQVVRAGDPVSPQIVEDFAMNSTQYALAVAGLNSSFQGFNNDWTLSEATCTISWHDATASFLVTNAHDVKYILTVAENPLEGIIYNVALDGVFVASIAQTNSETYSGYAVADSSTPTSNPVDYASSTWYAPSVEVPSDPSPYSSPSCKWTGSDSSTECIVEFWTGLQNSTYDGPNHIPAHTGEVVQTGTFGNETCGYQVGGAYGCTSVYKDWSEYVRGYSNGNASPDGPYYCYPSPGEGDEVVGQVGSKLYFNDTSSNYTYTILTDYGSPNTTICSHFYNNGEVHTEYYADYFAETPQYGSSFFTLPEFTSPTTFYDCGMATGQTEFGAYPNYSNGYGFGSYIYNSDTTNTDTGTMYENSGSTYGYFGVTWVNSYGT